MRAALQTLRTAIQINTANGQQKRREIPAFFNLLPNFGSGRSILLRIIHVEFDWMGRHAETRHFLHFQLDIRIDHAVAEHATTGQELAVLIKVLECLIKR